MQHASSDGSRPLSPDMQMQGSGSNPLSQGRLPMQDRLHPDGTYPPPSGPVQSGYPQAPGMPQGGFPPMQPRPTHSQQPLQQQSAHLQQQMQQQAMSGLVRERGASNGPQRQSSDQGGPSQSRGGSEVEPGSMPLQGRSTSGAGPGQSTAAAGSASGGTPADQQVRQRMMSALVARLSKEQRQALSDMTPQQQVTLYRTASLAPPSPLPHGE